MSGSNAGSVDQRPAANCEINETKQEKKPSQVNRNVS